MSDGDESDLSMVCSQTKRTMYVRLYLQLST